MDGADTEPGRDEGEGPEHRVQIAEFAAGKYVVTRGQWAAFVAATGRDTHGGRTGPEADPKGSWRDPGFAQDDSHPSSA